MSSEQITIRSVKQYFNTYIYENRDRLNDVNARARIKLQLLDVFRKEVFDQISLRYGDEVLEMTKDDLAQLDGIRNILTNAFRKWRRLCMLCGEAGLINWLRLEDLRDILNEAEDAKIQGADTDGDKEVAENAGKDIAEAV